MKYRKCEICGLRTERKDGQKRYFMARFPLDEARCRKWVKATGNEDLAYVPIEKLHNNKFVCGKHFQVNDFKKKETQLKNTAVPTVQLTPVPLSDEILTGFPCHIHSTNLNSLEERLKTVDHVSGDHGHSSSTSLLGKRTSATVDLNIGNLISVDTELKSAGSHNDTESHSEVPDATGPFTWQKHSEVIVSDDEDDELRKRSETETDNVLYDNNKHTSELNIRREGELQLQCDENEERDESHCQNYKCNICSSPIHGFRYRCVQCADYDLCAACEARGAHERHYVLRIPGSRPYAEIENVLNKIRKELVDMNNTVLFEHTDMLVSLKEEVEDEVEDPLHESQSAENSDRIVAANNLDEIHDDDQLENDINVQSIAEENRRHENDHVAHENDNMTQANDVTHEVGKANNTHISRNFLTASNLKVISLKRKMNESHTKLPNTINSNVQQPLDSKKKRILLVPNKQLLDIHVSNTQQGLSSNKIVILAASAKRLPSNVSSIQSHSDSNKISSLPASAKQLPDNVSSVEQDLDASEKSILPTTNKHLPVHFRTRPEKV